MYSDLTIVNELLHTWAAAVNDLIKSERKKDDAPIIEIVRVLPESLPPNLTNIYVDLTENNNEVVSSNHSMCQTVIPIRVYNDFSLVSAINM